MDLLKSNFVQILISHSKFKSQMFPTILHNIITYNQVKIIPIKTSNYCRYLVHIQHALLHPLVIHENHHQAIVELPQIDPWFDILLGLVQGVQRHDIKFH